MAVDLLEDTRLDLRCNDLQDGRYGADDGYRSCANSKVATSLNGEEDEGFAGADLRAASNGGAASEFVSSQ